MAVTKRSLLTYVTKEEMDLVRKMRSANPDIRDMMVTAAQAIATLQPTEEVRQPERRKNPLRLVVVNA